MNKLQELIHDITIINFKKAIPNYTEEQLNFANDIAEKLILDSDTNKVNVVPAPCGFGKSVLIRCYLNAVISTIAFGGFGIPREEYKGDGFVIVTDMLDRFLDYEEDDNLEGYYYQMRHDKEEDFQKQLAEQDDYPILLMSTQKYFKLKENERDFIFRWKYGLRKTVIFDEKPLFYTVNEIDKEFINDIDNEIGKISETEDKNFLNSEIKYLKDYFENEWYKLSSKFNKDAYCYWKGTRTNMSTNDDKFISLINKYLSQESKDKAITLKDILENGAIFINKKNINASDSRRLFFTIGDNKEGFYLGQDKAKFWVFDATADLDIEYERDYINMINVEHTKDYKVNIRNIDVRTSKNNIRNKDNRGMLNNYITSKYNKENTLIASYKEGIGGLAFGFDKKDYFGGMKGVNDYRECTSMVQIGLNRYSDVGYLQIYLSLHPEVYNYIKNNPSASEEVLENLLELERGNFTNEEMNHIMYSKLAVDTEQNIFRTKIRNYSNTDTINIDLLYNKKTYNKLNAILAERLGIDEIKVNIPIEILEYDILSRRNKKESHAQKIVRWFKENEGYGEITTEELLELNGITNEQFKYAKRGNKSLIYIMDLRRIKRGTYIA